MLSDLIQKVLALKLKSGLIDNLNHVRSVALEEKGKQRAGGAVIGSNVPTPAGDVGFGTNITQSASVEHSDTLKASEDIVFAYQLLEIDLKGWKGTKIKYDELRHKSALLDKDDERQEEENSEDELIGLATTNVVGENNIPFSRSAVAITTVEIGESKRRLTCIAAENVE
ncbi:MAG: hypothetical protein Q9167_006998 [Letrouitia subvulpina]